MNAFEVLNVPQRFDLSQSEIEKAYRAMMSSAHPDLAGGAVIECEGQVDAVQLNEARLMLLNSEKRANELLRCLHGPSASESQELPDGFLMEMMMKREEIEEEIASQPEGARARWESWAEEQRAQYEEDTLRLFNAIDDIEETERVSSLVDIRVLLNAWRYIERLIEQLDPEYDPAKADF